jgi:hypothetical protein
MEVSIFLGIISREYALLYCWILTKKKRNRAKYGVEEMCRDLWNWASKNPCGYGSSDESNN